MKIKYLPIESFLNDDFNEENIKIYINKLYTPLKEETINYKINLEKIDKINNKDLVEIGKGKYNKGMIAGGKYNENPDKIFNSKLLKPDVLNKKIDIEGVLWEISNMALEDNRLRIQLKIKDKYFDASIFQPFFIESDNIEAKEISFLTDSYEETEYRYVEYIFDLKDISKKEIDIETFLKVEEVIEGNWELNVPVEVNKDKLMINKDIKIKDLIIDKITIDSFGFQLSIGEKEGLLSNKDDEEIIKEKISPIVIKMEDGVEIKSEYSYSSNISTKEDSKYNKTIVDGEFDSSIDFKRKKVLKLIPIKEDIIVENKLEDFNNISERTLYIWNKLNRDERALLYGRIMEELSYEELSKIHNISEETLRKRYQRAKEKFLKYNEKY